VLAAFNAGDDGRAQRALDRTVADAAAWAGALLDAELHAAYVRDLPTFLLDLDVVEKRKYVAGQERLAARALAKRLRTFRGKRFVPHASAGRPEHQLPRLARELRPRLVVFGTSARRGVERFLFGSTSEQVMAQVRTDTLVVKRGGR
jgi:nucleotide-binding universal stress UspA family protein